MSDWFTRSFAGNAPSTASVVVMGGSISDVTLPTYKSYWDQLQDALPSIYPSTAFTFYKYTEPGTPSAVRVVDLQLDVIALAPQIIIIDAVVNDGGSNDDDGGHADGWQGASEAFVRTIRTNLPNCVIVVVDMLWPESYSHMSQARIDARRKWQRVCSLYDCAYVSMADAIQAKHQTATPNDTTVELYYPDNNVHPIQAGHNLFFEHLKGHIAPSALVSVPSQQWTGTLSDYPRMWTNSDDWEQSTQEVPASNMTRSGTWTEDGDNVTSSTVSDSLSYTGTFSGAIAKFSNSGSIRHRINGGSWSSSIDLSAYSGDTRRILTNAVRGSNTIEIEVVSGTVTVKQLLLI